MAEEREYELLGRMVEVTGVVSSYEFGETFGDDLVESKSTVEKELMLRLDQVTLFSRLMIKLFGYRLEIKVRPHRARRSDRQNRYMWGVVVVCIQAWNEETGELDVPIFDDEGNPVLDDEGYQLCRPPTKEEVYTWLRIVVLGHRPQIVVIQDVEVITMTGKRFSQMTTKEFADAVDEIQKFMAQKDIIYI